MENIRKWQEYLICHNFGGSLWTEFQKSNRKKPNETYIEYKKRLSLEYMQSKQLKDPIIGKFDTIIERLDTIISKMNNPTYIAPTLPPAPQLNLPPLPPPPPPITSKSKDIIIPKQTKPLDDSQEPIQVRLLNELKRKLLERESKGSGIDEIHDPLCSDEIQQKIPCKFILYENMDDVKDIRQLLPMTLILYQLARVGHFCCVFENEEGINFFDPLGYAPDEQLKMAGGYAPDHDFTYLVQLLGKSDKPIIYNNYKLQAKSTSTCGHWCTVRMACRGLYCDEFAKCFKGVKNRDKTIVKIYNSL